VFDIKTSKAVNQTQDLELETLNMGVPLVPRVRLSVASPRCAVGFSLLRRSPSDNPSRLSVRFYIKGKDGKTGQNENNKENSLILKSILYICNEHNPASYRRHL
jgi:hypothetical protein